MTKESMLRVFLHFAEALVIVAVLFNSTVGGAEPTEVAWNASFDGVRSVKALDHSTILWDIKSTASDQPQVEVFSRDGVRTHRIGVLRSVPEATSVGIWDLSVDAVGNVAVAAVFSRPECRREPTLLLYNRGGQLRNAIGLADGRSISRLEFDDDGSIWALGHHSGTLNPAETRMLFHYSSDGRELGAFVSRDQFPEDAEFTEEGSRFGGAPGMGVTEDLVWFWLPASQRLATMRKDGSSLAIYTTGLPDTADTAASSGAEERRTEVSRVALTPSGELLAQASVFGPIAALDSGIFRWSLAEGWEKIESPHVPQGTQLMNVSRNGDLLVRQPSEDSGRIAIAVATLP